MTMDEQLKTQRISWLTQKADAYTGSGFDPEGRMAALGSNRRPLAISARCGQCIGSADPHAGKRIAECAMTTCSLYPHRSHQTGGYRANLDALKATAPAAPRGIVMSPIDRARANPASRHLAIRAYCYDCMGGQPIGHPNKNGNVRRLIGECTATRCALWDVRPWQHTDDEAAEEENHESEDA
jgi:hypothetical protein